MTILQINKFFFLKGGTERYYFSLMDLLKKNGHEVIPFSMQHPKNIEHEYSKYFAPNFDVSKPRLNMIGQSKQFIWSKKSAQALETLLANIKKPDIAHIHNIYHQLSPSILEVLKKHNIPVIMTAHDYKLICPNYSLYTKNSPCTQCKGHNYQNAIKNKCLKNSYLFSALGALEMSIHKYLKIYENSINKIIVPSHFVKSQFIEFGQNSKQIQVLPHFISDSFLHQTIFETNNISNNHEYPYLLYAGRLEKMKGINYLVELFANHHLPYKLHIAGTGTEFEYIKKLIISKKAKKEIHLLGHLSNEDLIKQIIGAKATIIPSFVYETFGLSALESIALGTPVLAFASGGLPEIITKDVGRVIQPENEEQLLQAIRSVNQWNPFEVKASAQQLIEQKYSSLRHYEELMKIYFEFIS